MELPELYAVLKGEVASIMEYGVFIKIPGCRKQGLVHRTHMSSCRVENPAEIVDVGEKVWVKVIGKEMQDEKVKLSLSMKAVNQGTGKDLDPNNVILEQDERKRREFRDYSKQRITLEAVLNTVCKKCGCKGHFAKDCFSQPGGMKYGLVPEEEEEGQVEVPGQQPSQSEKAPAKKRKKEKKMKKQKHKEKRGASDSDSSDSSSAEDTKRRRSSSSKKQKKKKHKMQKHKGHRHRD
ncbi:nucleolar protein of 40 kDa-like isoform X1 [Acipenser oxyrinchus oxyrinchus]|uniref:Zinc finger CCHC domain-containing protein 17 n=1 Tax=Acipenser oxyrinchus oxyrinchus TaxID=40147 RepID=A0AAD8CLX1_ACIOX|nr:nucleolar protein of 40 kDa-like isoform X1 [Acipenser oxyrinchus oxyrinchus]